MKCGIMRIEDRDRVIYYSAYGGHVGREARYIAEQYPEDIVFAYSTTGEWINPPVPGSCVPELGTHADRW